jgi:hypothetical protein
VPNSHWLQEKSARINLSQGASGYIFAESKVYSCMHFHCQNRRLRVFEAVTGRIFKIGNFKGANKNFEFGFFIY